MINPPSASPTPRAIALSIKMGCPRCFGVEKKKRTAAIGTRRAGKNVPIIKRLADGLICCEMACLIAEMSGQLRVVSADSILFWQSEDGDATTPRPPLYMFKLGGHASQPVRGYESQPVILSLISISSLRCFNCSREVARIGL